MNGETGIFSGLIRSLFVTIDTLGYHLLSGVYDIFFTVANANILQGDTINSFYSRVQLILGVFMVFKLALAVLQIIVNPDTFKDKNKGAGNLVMRIAVVLVLLTLIAPIQIPANVADDNPLNEKIQSNGILFGFLYQFQESVVEDNILGKLVLASNIDTLNEDEGLGLNSIGSVGEMLSTTIAESFITPALNPDIDPDDIASQDDLEAALACPDVIDSTGYMQSNNAFESITTNINESCSGNYAYDYTILGGLVTSIIMVIIILGFTIDVAVRAIKLAVLRLIAPIPIISYIVPGQEKNGAFGNWVKSLTSTYLDLFIRLIVIYFGIYVILEISQGGADIWQNSTNWFTSGLSTIFIIIGILVFMKQAPKFFKDMFGIKGGDGSLFGGIGTMLGGAALIGGLAGSAATNYRATRDEVLEDGGSSRQARLRGALSAFAGVGGGALAGAGALMHADKKQAGAVFSAMQRRNATRAEGASLLRRAYAGGSAIVTGQAPGSHDETLLKVYDELQNKATANKKMMEDQARKSKTITGKLSFGPGDNDYIKLNYTNFENMVNNARARGEKTVTATGLDYAGNTITKRFDLDTLDPNVMNDFFEDSVIEYGKWQAGLSSGDPNYDKKLAGTAEEYVYAAKTAQMNVNGYDYKGTKGTAGIAINEKRSINASRKSSRYRAAARHVGAPPPGGRHH